MQFKLFFKLDLHCSNQNISSRELIFSGEAFQHSACYRGPSSNTYPWPSEATHTLHLNTFYMVYSGYSACVGVNRLGRRWCLSTSFSHGQQRKGGIIFRFAFFSPSSECQNPQIFLKCNCLQRFPRQGPSEALRKLKPGIKEFKAKLWEIRLSSTWSSF